MNIQANVIDVTPTDAAAEAVAKGDWTVDYRKGQMRGDVSAQWWNRPDDQKYLSLRELRDATKARYDGSKEARIDNRKIELFTPEIKTKADTQRLHVGLPDGTESNFSNWSFGQACGLAGAPPAYLRSLASPLVADNLNYGLRYNRGVEQVKTYYDAASGGELHAVTGPDYGRIPDYEMVEAIMQIAGDGDGEAGWKVPGIMDWSTGRYNPHVDVTKESTTLFASDRDVFLFLVDDLHPVEVGKLPNGDPDLMFRGFYAWNSEMGAKSYGIAAMYLRGVCMNRCLWGVENFTEFKGRHSKNAPDRFVTEATPALHSFAHGDSKTLVEGVEAAKQARIAHNDEEAIDFLRNRGFAKNRTAEILETVEREEGTKARSVWDIAQGITAVARKLPHQDARLQMEQEAGKLLNKVA